MLVAADSPPSEGEIPYFFHMPKVSGSWSEERWRGWVVKWF
jgi:hypothetical protein